MNSTQLFHKLKAEIENIQNYINFCDLIYSNHQDDNYEDIFRDNCYNLQKWITLMKAAMVDLVPEVYPVNFEFNYIDYKYMSKKEQLTYMYNHKAFYEMLQAQRQDMYQYLIDNIKGIDIAIECMLEKIGLDNLANLANLADQTNDNPQINNLPSTVNEFADRFQIYRYVVNKFSNLYWNFDIHLINGIHYELLEAFHNMQNV